MEHRAHGRGRIWRPFPGILSSLRQLPGTHHGLLPRAARTHVWPERMGGAVAERVVSSARQRCIFISRSTLLSQPLAVARGGFALCRRAVVLPDQPHDFLRLYRDAVRNDDRMGFLAEGVQSTVPLVRD